MKVNEAEYCNSIHSWTALSYTTSISAIILSVVTVPANLTLIVVLAKSKCYQSNFYLIMLNMAISDLFVGTAVDPLGAALIMKEALRMGPTENEVH